jgi:hypothetical protein
MQRPDKYLPWLLKSFLRSPHSAREVSEKFECTAATALRRLRNVGARQSLACVRQGKRGPESAMWVIPQ